MYNGTALAGHGDVIVASMNYRVGSLGFLSSGDWRIPGVESQLIDVLVNYIIYIYIYILQFINILRFSRIFIKQSTCGFK